MKKLIFLLLFTSFINTELHSNEINKQHQTDWLIVGAGPGGVCAIGVLLDLGVSPEKITWLDPEFNVGRLSSYKDVFANTKTKFFVQFLESCKTFKSYAPDAIEDLKKFDQDCECQLINIIKPLQVITNYLKEKVNSIKGSMLALNYYNDVWNVQLNNNNNMIEADHVVLATGSHPKRLNYDEFKNKEIDLDKALDLEFLSKAVNKNDTVAVVGGAHSAILLLKYLSELNVRKIYNFYLSPIKYPVDMGTWVLNDETGILGVAANWAKNVLEKGLAKNIERILSTPENLQEILPKCTKIIYAIGFEKNELPYIKENPNLDFDSSTGVIGPKLFGIGIAFPEKIVDPLGNIEYRVGLYAFLKFAQKNIPNWIKKNVLRLHEQEEMLSLFAKLFVVEVL